MTGNDWLTLFAGLALASLIPIVYAIVDVVRRPAWQFSTGRKVMWAVTLGIGWLVLWPVALISSIVYLTVLRRRFPPASQIPPHDPRFGQYGSGQYGGPYGGGQYGGPYGGGQYGTGGDYGSQQAGGPYGGAVGGSPGPPSYPGARGAPPAYPGGQGGPPAYPGSYGYPPQGQPPVPPVPPPLPPAGWYPDPAGSAKERWWDGRGWSDHIR